MATTGQAFNDIVLRTSGERLNVRTSREFDNSHPPYPPQYSNTDDSRYENNLFVITEIPLCLFKWDFPLKSIFSSISTISLSSFKMSSREIQ